jgi:hypothetical protein
MAVLRDLVLVF